MNNFGIVSDTSHDLSAEYVKEHNIKNVSFYVRLDGGEDLRDLVDITREEMYDFMESNPDKIPMTSLPSVEDYLVAYRENLDQGLDVLCFAVSTALSGSYQSARVAANMAMEEYPDRKVYVVDARAASLGVAILIRRAVDMRTEGKSVDEVHEKVVEIANTTATYIALDTLTYLEKGGRISKTGAFAGNLLRIKPIVTLIDNILKPEAVVRSTKRANRKLLELLDERIGHDPSAYDVSVIHGNVKDRALEVKEIIEEKHNINLAFDVALVACAVISHIGPGAISVIASKKL